MRWLDAPEPGPRSRLVLAAVLLVAGAFRLVGLGYPGEEYFDEVYHAKTALQYLQGETPTEWVHPPTAKLLIAVGVRLFGYHPWAWRLAPALAGTALAGVFLLLARRVLGSERAALLATALLLCDGVYLVQSRVAMTNVFAVLFQLLSALLVLRAAAQRRLRWLPMLAAGVALGLALSTRWTSLFAWVFLGAVFLVLRRDRRRATADPEAVPPGARCREAALAVLTFALVPAAVYLLSYVPLMLQAHPRGGSGWAHAIASVVHTQRDIWSYHANLRATHAYFSPWWSWPLLLRPTWYFWASGPGTVRGIVALGNPLLWWASLPVSAWALVSGLRSRDPRRAFAGLGFFALYLPWGISPRTLNFSHYLFEAIPYACLGLAILLDRAWDGPNRGFAWAYVAATALLFLHFLPFLTAMPVPVTWWSFRLPTGGGLWRWLPSWT